MPNEEKVEVEVEPEEPEEPEEEEEEEEEPGSEEEEPDEELDEESSLTKKEQLEAKNLYKLLKDPKTSSNVLKVLAQQAGILNNDRSPIETAEDVKEAKQDLRKILEESLGPDLKWLVPKLGPALEKILNQERESNSTRVDELEHQKVQDDVVRISDKLNRETKGDFKRFESRMSQLADEILPSSNMSVEKYMRYLYNIASSERRSNQQKSQLADKINRNASNASERLRSAGSPHAKDDGPKPGKDGKISVRDAVNYAMKQQVKK